MKKFKRIAYIAMFIVLTMVIQLFSGVVFTPATVLALEPLDDLTLFGRLSQADLSGLGHVRATDRFMDKMNMIEYENENGTYSTYLFAQPIKYLDTATNTIRYVKDEDDITAVEKTMGAIAASADSVSYVPVQDAEVSSYSPTTNYSTGNSVTVGYIPYSGATFETYVKFDLSTIQSVISYDQVVSACYAMYQETYYEYDEMVHVGCYRVASSWTPTTVTWNTKPSCDTEHLAVETVCTSSPSNTTTEEERLRYHYFMITNLAQGWLQGIPNYGLAFKRISGAEESRTFASTESYLTTRIPFFRITYTTSTSTSVNIGVKDGRTYYLKQNGLYLDATGGTLSKAEFTGSTAQRWKLYTNAYDHFYLIPQSNTSLGLTYTSSTIGLASIDASEPYEFQFIRNWNGTYHITTHTYPTKGIGSPSPTSTSVSLRTLSTSLTNYDDWTLEPVGENTANWAMAQDIDGEDQGTEASATWIEGDSNVKLGLTYGGWNFSLKRGIGVLETVQALTSSNFCGLHAHGGQGCLYYPGETYNWISANSIMLPNGQTSYGINTLADNSLARVRVVLLAACSTGNDATVGAGLTDKTTQEVYNLASALYNKGAHLVISFVNSASAQNWYPIFFGICAQGKTIAEAIAEADAYVLQSCSDTDLGNMLNRHVLGDTNLRMNVYG